MKMNVATQCIILLAFVSICNSLVIPKCRCLKNNKFVKPSLIADVRVYDPRPYCNRREIIVTLKDGSERCLKPEINFTKELLKRMKQVKSGNKTTISPKTTTASTTVPNSS